MKPHGKGCSCTSCISQSGSRHYSVQKFIADGSKIDKLYLGKYIPLREQKLLTKLVRTRAIYDDVRNVILSSSSVSVRAGKQKKHGEKSSAQAVLDIVNLVDKGGITGGKRLSACCSCCICAPDGIRKHMHKHHRHSHSDLRGHHGSHGAQRTGSVPSRTSLLQSRIKAGGSRAKKRARDKIKNIKSVPCACTFKINDMIKLKSKAVMKKIQEQKAKAAIDTSRMEFYDTSFEKQGAKKAKDFAIKSYQTLKEKESEFRRGFEDSAKKSLKKIHNICECELRRSLKDSARNTMEKFKDTKNMAKHKMKVHSKRSIESLAEVSQKIKDKMINFKERVQTVPHERSSGLKSVPIDKKFNLKKDSVTKFKDKLQRRKDMEAQYRKHRREDYRDHGASSQESTYSDINLHTAEKIHTAGVGPGKKRVKIRSSPISSATEQETDETGVNIESDDIGHHMSNKKPESKVTHENKVKKRELKDTTTSIQKKDRAFKEERNVHAVQSVTSATEPTLVRDTSVEVEGKGLISESPKKTRNVCECEIIEKQTLRRSRPKSVSSSNTQPSQASLTAIHDSKTVTIKVIKEPREMSIRSGKLKGEMDRPGKKKDRSYKKKSIATVKSEMDKSVKKKDLRYKKYATKPWLAGKDSVVSVKTETDEEIKEHKISSKSVVSVSSQFSNATSHETRQASVTSKSERDKSNKKKDSRHKKYGTKSPLAGAESIRTEHVANKELRYKKYATKSWLAGKKSVASAKSGTDKKDKKKERRYKKYATKSWLAGKKSVASVKSETEKTDKIKDGKLYATNSWLDIEKPKKSKNICECEELISPQFLFKSVSSVSSQISEAKSAVIHKTRQNAATSRETRHASVTSKSERDKSNKKKDRRHKKYGTKPPLAGAESIRTEHDVANKELRYKKYATKSWLAGKKSVASVKSETDKSQDKIKDGKLYAADSWLDIGKPKKSKNICECEELISPKFPFKSVSSVNETIKQVPKAYKEPTKHKKRHKSGSSVGIQMSAATDQAFVKSKTDKLNKNRHPYHQKDATKLSKANSISTGSINTVYKRTNKKSRNICECEELKSHKVRNKSASSVSAQMSEASISAKKIKMTDSKSTISINNKEKSILYPKKDAFVDKKSIVSVKKRLKDTKTGAHALKRCFCTLKIKAKKPKQAYSKWSVTKETTSHVELSNEISQTTISKIQEPIICGCEPEERDLKRSTSSAVTATTQDTKSVSTSYTIDKLRKKKNRRHQGKKYLKDTQTGAHALKRCFCTLKIKAKKPRLAHSKSFVTKGTTSHLASKLSNESIQTKFSDKSNAKRRLSSTSTAVTQETKSISTLYTTAPSITSKVDQSQLTKKDKYRQKYTAHKPSSASIKHKIKCVCKLKLKPGKEKMHTTRTSHSVKKHNKKSDTQHKLRPYECEPGICIPDECDPYDCLKIIEKRNNQEAFSNTDNRKNNFSITKNRRSKSVSRPGKEKMHTTRTSHSVKKHNKKSDTQHKLRPYECEPGICIPDEYDPYDCLKIIEKRNNQEAFSNTDNRKNNFSITKNRRSKSVSSITSRGNKITPKAKRVQSTVASYDTGAISPRHKDNTLAATAPRDVRTSPNIPHRQVVRIESSFSFNIEFYKDKNKPTIAENAPTYESKPTYNKKTKNNPREITYMKEHGSQGDMNQETKSVTVQVEKETKNARTTVKSALKRCFCTLKLMKNQTKYMKEKEETTRGTNTSKLKQKVNPIMSTKATKTKGFKYKQHGRKLEPYECEPNICVPGECDPYECLERIKRRGHSKEHGTSTDKTKRKTESSNSESNVNVAISPIKVTHKEQKASANFRQIKKNAAKEKEMHYVPPSPKNIAEPKEIHFVQPSFKGPSRQVVKIGSSCSFNIEFYKDKNPKSVKNQNAKNVNKKLKAIEKGAKREMSLSNQSSQFKDRERNDKATGIKPMLKRCFCTLQLMNKKERKKHKNASNYLARTTNVYTVSRIGETTFSAQNYLRDIQTKILETNMSDKPSIGSEITSKFEINSHYPQTLQEKLYNIALMKDFIYINQLENSSCNAKFLKDMKNSIDPKNEILSKSKIIQAQDKMQYQVLRDNCTTDMSVRQTQSKHINSFFRRCFYAMNIRTEKRQHKLKPYECEPGVCIPYECDPYECKKLIDARLRDSKQSGTKSSLKSSASSSSYTRTKDQDSRTSDTKRTARQQATKKQPSARTKPTQPPKPYKPPKPAPVIQYKTGPRPKQRQAVRVGSSFSFDIQFYKDKAPSSQEQTIPVKKEKKAKHKTEKRKPDKKLQKKEKRNVSNRDTQSRITKVERGSSSFQPKLKRCFCTLKLQQSAKGVHKESKEKTTQKSKKEKPTHREIKVGNHKNRYLEERNNAYDVSSSTSSTMTRPKKSKPYKLLPYECEPGFCIPGECDPYECLEVIKKRQHNKGSEASTETRSDSSYTRQRKKIGKNLQSGANKNRAVKVKQPKQTRGNTVRAKEVIVTEEPVRPPPALSPPQRQVVRIGSSFSFNIEFYKDRNPNTEQIQTAAKEVKTNRKKQKINTKNEKQKKVKEPKPDTKTTQSYNQRSDSNESQTATKESRDSQTVSYASKLKRCFCTLTLQKQRKIAGGERRKQKPEKRNKSQQRTCKCYEGQASQGTNTKRYKEIPTLYTRSVYTKNKIKLKSYECEPGICIPGECNPYECYDRIQKRLREFGTGTDHNRIKSASSSMGANYKTKKIQHRHNKNRKAGSQAKLKRHQQRQKTSASSSSRPERRPVSQPREVMRPTRRQAVRIGSGYSFDIEFYKNRSISVPRSPKYHDEKPSKIVKKKTTESQDFSSLRTKDSQSGFGSNIRSTTTNTTQRLKRCFCTLSLKKQGDKNNPQYTFPRGAGRTKQVFRLEPYECEPYVCVPGECDPYECLERIKRRNRKELGTSTGPYQRSTGSSNTLTTSTRARKNQKICRNPPCDTSSMAMGYRPSDSSSPTVKIGSSFKFNVEFYKDRSYGDHELVESSPPVTYTKIIKPPPAPRPSPVKMRGTQRSRGYNNADTQVSEKSKEHSTGMNPILKRCFCTLKLLKQKSPNAEKGTNKKEKSKKVEVILPPKSMDRSTRTRQFKPTHNLEPYECEPGFCIPGECDPYVCLERIRKRDIRNQGTGISSRPPPCTAACAASDSGRDIQTQAMCKPECKSKMAGNDSEKYIVEDRRFKNIENPFRQTVHISSSFSFSVEFIKDTGLPGTRQKAEPSTPPPVREPVNRRVCTKSTCPNKNRRVQGEIATVDKGTGKGALLKRCFCTLKLQKQGHLNAKTDTGPFQPTNLSTDVGVGNYKLKSYECEPNVCIPGECDPYECLERIKRRQIKHSAIGTGPTNRSATTLTSMGTKMCREAQCAKDPRRCQNTQCRMRRPIEKPKVCPPDCPKRQSKRESLKYGTKFGFDIDIFKDAHNGVPKYKQSTKMSADQAVFRKSGTRDRGSCPPTCPTVSKGSGIAPRLKRCFCTLKLMKGACGKEQCVNYVSVQVKPPMVNNRMNLNDDFHYIPAMHQLNYNHITTRKRKINKYKTFERAPNIRFPDKETLCESYEYLQTKGKKQYHYGSVGISCNNELQCLRAEKKYRPEWPCKCNEFQSKLIADTKNIHLDKLPPTKLYSCHQNQNVSVFFHKTHTSSNFTKADTKKYKKSKANNKNYCKKSQKAINETEKSCVVLAKTTKYKNKGASKLLHGCVCNLDIQNNNKSSFCKKTPYTKVNSVKRKSVDEDYNELHHHKHKIKKRVYKNCQNNSEEILNKELNKFNLKDNLNSTKRFRKSVYPEDIDAKQTKNVNPVIASSFGLTFKGILRRIASIFKRSSKSNNPIKPEIDNTKSLVSKTTKLIRHTNKADTIKTSKSDRHPTISKVVSSLKKTNSLKLRKSEINKYIDAVDFKQRPYSKFQSGDGGPKDLDKLNKTKPPLTGNIYNNDVICAYCYAKYDRDIKRFQPVSKSPYIKENVVQLALVPPNCNILSEVDRNSICRCLNKGKIASKKTSQKNAPINDKDVDDKISPKSKAKSKKNPTVEKDIGDTISPKSKGKSKKKSTLEKDEFDSISPKSKSKSKKQPIVNKDAGDNFSPKSKKQPKVTREAGDISLLNNEYTCENVCDKNKKKEDKIIPKFVCKTKSPCACCKGPRQTGSLLCSKLFGDKPEPAPVPVTDQPVSKKPKNKKTGSDLVDEGVCSTVCKTKPVQEKGLIMKMFDNMLTTSVDKKEDVCNYDPVLQMKFDSGSLAVLNRDEIFEKVKELKIKEAKDKLTPEELKRLHGDSCRCCVCHSMKKKRKERLRRGASAAGAPGAPVPGAPAAGAELGKKVTKSKKEKICDKAKIAVQLSLAMLDLAPRPCICGSKPCAEKTKRDFLDRKKKPPTPCVCRTKICQEEALKLALKKRGLTKAEALEIKRQLKILQGNRIKGKGKGKDKGKSKGKGKGKGKRAGKKKLKGKFVSVKGKKKLTKAQIADMKLNQKEYEGIEARYAKKDRERLELQEKKEKEMNKNLRAIEQDNFCVLVFDSFIDVMRVIVRIITGILRTLLRTIFHPKRAFKRLKAAIRRPKLICTYFYDGLKSLGILFALKRIYWRMTKCYCWAWVKRNLESNSCTYYMLHMFDKDKKTRRMPNSRRKRESGDFGCKLFMISLRSKPCMCCYYRFPWFYSRCLTILRLLKTLMDTLLFILAVIVWSPLLLCMEMCRALMCCTMCTG